MASDPLKPLSPKHWDAQKAQHLLNRAGFGIPRERVAHMTKQGHRKSVKSLIEYDTLPKYGESPTFLVPLEAHAETRKIKDEIERREARNMVQRQERQAMQLLKQWWLERMVNSPRPLEEKMTLFWHGHFATSAQKVKLSRSNEQINNLFRLHATGNFKELTTAVGKSHSMLVYLDNNRNVKKQPNENWARELMELFTIGIGNYTEDDIKESARAFTGWTFNRMGEFYINTKVHDEGRKTFLGQTGNFEGQDIINIIFQQPEVSEFISTKLYTFFVHEEPDEKVIQAMASEMRNNRYEIKPVLERLFLSEAFYNKKAMGSQIKSPVQFIVQLAHDMNIQHPPYSSMARSTQQLGQDLFYPPNVKGWDGGRTWINANTLLTRYNLPVSIGKANGELEMMRMEDSMNASMEPSMSPDNSKNNVSENRRAEFIKVLRSLPEKQALKYRQRMKKAKSPQERLAIYQTVITQHGDYDRWDANQVFDDLAFTTAQDCVTALSDRFLSRPLNKEQQALLAEALGAKDGLESPLKQADLTPTHKNAALHLLLSTAEYQLC